MKHLLIVIACLFFQQAQAQYTQFINPMIGTNGTGHTFPGPTLPFAMVQLSPDTRIDDSWEGCSGYYYKDSLIHGFSHTHLSGTGCSDYGDIAFMPWFSKTDILENLKTQPISSSFSHKKEEAKAGYYRVTLNQIPVQVELTTTTRTGLQRYTFSEAGFGYIILNLKHRDELLEGTIHANGGLTFSGIRRSKAWAKDQVLYYATAISNANPKTNLRADYFITKDKHNDVLLLLRFKTYKGQQVLIKTGLSSCDEKGAQLNLQTENPYWDFAKTQQQATQAWEKELQKIQVLDKSNLHKTSFYTAMYHAMIHPSILNDVDGRYKGRDGKIHRAEGFNYYTVFSLWDTHRALHPLLNIIDKKRSHDFICTFQKQYEQSGRLPMWELWNNETDCMIGFHSVSVILDAFMKQVISLEELQNIWPAVQAEAFSNRFALDKFRAKGFLSIEDENESASKTAEYSYDMWCAAQIASMVGQRDIANYFQKLSLGVLNLQNPSTGFLHPRKNGNWLAKFDPFEVNNHFTEANSWQYSFYAPHLPLFRPTLLDSLFIVSAQTKGREQADITGLIGQYAHGNEPSHNYIYLLQNPHRIQYLQTVYKNFYTNQPDGLIGNEDCGQMSAWYVMSALGIYQTCPGSQTLSLGLPLFNQIKVQLPNQKSILIQKNFNQPNYQQNFIATGIGGNNKGLSYLHQNTTLQNWLNSQHITFTQTNTQPSYPIATTDSIHKTLAPNIEADYSKTFTGQLQVKLAASAIVNNQPTTATDIWYSTHQQPLQHYTQPFFIDTTTTIYAFAVMHQDTSSISVANFYKKPHNYTIRLLQPYHPQYTADGDDGIIDGQMADINWRKGGWQGYQNTNFEAIIDLQQPTFVQAVAANFLQDTRSWIIAPTKVEFYVAQEDQQFQLVQTMQNKLPATDYNIQTQLIQTTIQQKARYIKVKAYNFGSLPAWHQGAGGQSYIFIDEIFIH